MKLTSVRRLNLGNLLSFITASTLITTGASAASRPESTPPGWQTVDVVRTNTSTRVITNVIEVSVPKNVFVHEQRTNWVERTLTNFVEVFMTNWSTRTLTNTVTVNQARTNTTDRYVTNWTTLVLTNEIALTLTNWENVIVTKTNWIRQPVTQVVEVNAAAPAVPAIANTPPRDTLMLDAVKTPGPVGADQIEVKFRVQLAADAAVALQVQQWRVERDDGAVLFFAQHQEFKRAVPVGRYRVEVKARREADSPLLILRTTLDVTRDTVARR